MLYVHSATFPSALSIAHGFDGCSWRDALNDANMGVRAGTSSRNLAAAPPEPDRRYAGFGTMRREDSDMTVLDGAVLVGSAAVRGTGEAFRAIDPATGETLEPSFGGAGPDDVERACALADAAFDTYRETGLEQRAGFLDMIAQGIIDIGDALVERTCRETGLPRGRIEGERARTVGQLRLFAGLVRDGSWLDARIDPAMPERRPQPRVDLRLRDVPRGPVAVFGASNFPLAFSVAGGDTASALAAGCPVVVKAHPAHPGASELVGRALQSAAAKCSMPEGVFSLLFGVGNWLGGALVADPRIKAVGFTGSRAGGLALIRIAQERPEPIPVYAEMSSINPVILLPGALAVRAAAIGKDFVGSLTMGAGQFCTNPGLILALDGPEVQHFVTAVKATLEAWSPAPMLTSGIFRAYQAGVTRLLGHQGVSVLAQGQLGAGVNCGQSFFFGTDAETFLADETLKGEVFGASSLLVRCRDLASLHSVVEHLEGQLTVTLHMEPRDFDYARSLLPTLERKAGRLLANGWPTGVEVGHAMVHGGPFPATSDGGSTSVGTLAIRRFLRPVCYQDFPGDLIPEVLRDGNPAGVPRLRDGKPEAMERR